MYIFDLGIIPVMINTGRIVSFAYISVIHEGGKKRKAMFFCLKFNLRNTELGTITEKLNMFTTNDNYHLGCRKNG
jgi:hypothetical protein